MPLKSDALRVPRFRVEIERHANALRGYWYHAMVEKDDGTFHVISAGQTGDILTAANRASDALGKWLQREGHGYGT